MQIADCGLKSSKSEIRFFKINLFTPLEIMLPCSAAGLYFRTIPAGVNAPLEFLTGFTVGAEDELMEV